MAAASLIQCSPRPRWESWVDGSAEKPQNSDPHPQVKQIPEPFPFLKGLMKWLYLSSFKEEEFEMWVLSVKKRQDSSQRQKGEGKRGRTKREVPVL